MLGELYKPKGLALETAKAVLQVDNVYAINVAAGCDNNCKYPCYVPELMHMEPGEMRFPKEAPVELVRKQLKKGLKPEGVFFCFLTDPLSQRNVVSTEDAIYLLQEKGIKNIATLSKQAIVFWKLSPVKNGMTIVSFDEEFWKKYETNAISPQERLGKLELRKHMEGDQIWISCEPYPVSDIYPQDFREYLAHLKNVDFIIFGKWNYDPRANTEKARREYAENVQILEEFCKEHKIRYHVKSETLKFIKGKQPL